MRTHGAFKAALTGAWLRLARKRGSARMVAELRDADGTLVKRVVGWNLITNAGRQYAHKQVYGTSGLGANGLNYIALSVDAVTETATSTALSTEISTAGLSRTQGAVTLPTGSGNQTQITNVFTATGSISPQKAALFTASSVGTMCHVIAFSGGAIAMTNTQTLTVTFYLTWG